MSADNRLTPEERKARKNAYSREYYARPEVKARINARGKAYKFKVGYNARPEVKAQSRLRMAKHRARPQVKARLNEQTREYRRRPEIKARDREKRAQVESKTRARAWKYGITVEAVEALLAAGCMAAVLSPSNRCAGRMNIDHDHGCCNRDGSCGRCVRGALCQKHNTALARYESSLSWASKYLARHQAKQEGGRS